MGQPAAQAVSRTESIGTGGKPGELKHLMYPEERTSTETPLVVASERGPGQWPVGKNGKDMEISAIVGDSPVPVESQQVLE